MKSNFQKMHSALTDAYMVLTKAHMDNCPIPTGELVRVLGIIESALALKPCNCDAEYADRVEMYGAFKDWCKAKGHTMEPMLAYDAFDWLLALAEERKGDADGR